MSATHSIAGSHASSTLTSATQGTALRELQRVFVFLLLSQRYPHPTPTRFLFSAADAPGRRAYVPKQFLRVLPPWFTPGEQQDASEFGKCVQKHNACFLLLYPWQAVS